MQFLQRQFVSVLRSGCEATDVRTFELLRSLQFSKLKALRFHFLQKWRTLFSSLRVLMSLGFPIFHNLTTRAKLFLDADWCRKVVLQFCLWTSEWDAKSSVVFLSNDRAIFMAETAGTEKQSVAG